MAEDLALFSITATAIVIEAAPFLLLGSLLGAIIEVMVPDEALARILPRNAVGQVAVGLFAGMILPTCECGIVPIARRLLQKGVPPRTALPYMMAAPVVNPVVIASTLYAFQGDVTVVLLRILLVIVPAAGLGLALGNLPGHLVLRQGALPLDHGCGEHDHGCGCGCCSHASGNRLKDIFLHTAAEFVSMARFLVLGAVVASAFKTFLPPAILTYISDNTFLAIGGLMALAILLSVCSEADAFVAASLAGFPLTSQVAFMAIGPMVDLKLVPMFLAVFNRRIAIALTVVPLVVVFVLAYFLALGGW